MSANRTKNLRRLAVLLLALILLGSGGYLLWKQLDYQAGAADYAEAAETAAVPQLRAVPVPEQGEPAEPDPNPGLLAEVDLNSLREVNEDVRAWITIPDTLLSYPVVQCGDNQYYLNHTWQDKRSSVGAIFLECKCAPDFSDFNTIVYGISHDPLWSSDEQRIHVRHPAQLPGGGVLADASHRLRGHGRRGAGV